MKQLDPKQRWVGKFTLGKNEAVGELTYDPVTGITLEARIWPAPKDDPPFMGYPRISGHVGGDRPCTLFDAGDQSSRETSGEQFHNIDVNTIVLGLDCKSADESLFNWLSFQSPALTAFVQPRSIRVKQNYGKSSFTTSYRPMKPKTGKWSGHTITISALGATPTFQARDGTMEALEVPYYQIKFATSVSLNTVLDHLTALEFFLGLVVGQFGGTPSVFVGLADRQSSIQILRSRSWYAPFNYDTYRVANVSLAELGSGTIPAMARWFDMFPSLERVTETYRAAQLVPQIETNFIFLAQALEGLHRVRLNTKAIPPKDFKNGIKALRAAIPARMRGSSKTFFVNLLRSHNEPTLAARFGDLLKRVRSKIPMALEHAEEDIRGIVNLRNEFSHGTLGKIPKPFNYELISYYAHVIRTLFDIGLLILLGVPKKILNDIYYRNPRYSHTYDSRRRLERKSAVRLSRSKRSK
jgi:hypothetical protein